MEVFILVFLISCSAFFSATETALTSVNRIRLKGKAESGSKAAKRALVLVEKYDKVITTILIGNNVVNIAASSIATVLAMKIWEGDSNAPLYSTIIITLVVLIFGEITPKSIAKDNSESITLATSSIISFLTFLFTPFSLLFIMMKRGISKLMGGKNNEVSVTEQELMAIIDEIEDEGVLEEQESDLVKSALTFDETVVDEIITHRVGIVAVEVNDDIEKIKRLFMEEEYSRLPVYEKTIDHIIGYISQRDFYKKMLCGDDLTHFNTRDIMQDIHYVPHLMKISEILKTMQKEKIHMCVVLDQYGGTLGIVTLEDVLEQLVGEIWDENDEIISPVTFVSENTFNVAGDVSLIDFCRYFESRGITISIDSSAKTIGGWIMELFGKIPENNGSVRTDDFIITVLVVEDRRICKLKFELIQKLENDD